MKNIVVLGAGLGGLPMAFELQDRLKPGEKLTVVSKGDRFHFTPSNPWVAVDWRKREDIEVAIGPVLAKRGIAFESAGATRLHPEANEIELADGRRLGYDYLVIATGPDLAFDEIPGLGPQGHTQSICHVDHAMAAREAWEVFAATPGPSWWGRHQGASCFGPAYEFAMILDTDLRRRKIRDRVPMTFVTSEPYIGHLGLGGVGDTKGLLEIGPARAPHQMDHQRQDDQGGERAHVRHRGRRGRQGQAQSRPALRFAMMLPAFRGVPAVAGSKASPTRAASSWSTSTSAIRNSRTSSPSGSASPSRRSRRPRCHAGCRRPAS